MPLAAVVDAAANLQPVRNGGGGGGQVLDNGETYVKGMSAAFGKALDICAQVGVTKP